MYLRISCDLKILTSQFLGEAAERIEGMERQAGGWIEYAKNPRRTISKMRKIYFYDLGVRNSIINNYNLLADRADTGALFENFMIIERFKKQEYDKLYTNNYFLRTYDGAEIDLIEERGGKALGYEFKWKKRTGAKVKQLAGIDCKFITPENIKGFII